MRTILVLPKLKSKINYIAAVRSAEAFGVTEICAVSIRKLETFNGTIKGAQRHVKTTYFKNNDDCINYLIKEKIKIICLENCENSHSLLEFKFPANIAVVTGNENTGVPEEYLQVGTMVRIPQFGLVNCLNTAIAVSIVLFERFKSALKL